MPYTPVAGPEPEREEVDRMPGPVVIEFGADWCPHCQGVQPALKAALAAAPGITHIKVEDGKGKRLGRSFAVKLWPTLVLLRDGTEVAKVVRPSDAELREALGKLG